MSALREGAPEVRNALVAGMENPTIPDDSKKRGQGDISGAVEEQPQRQHHQHIVNVARQCVQLVAEKEAEGSNVDGDTTPRVLTSWMDRYEQLVSNTDIFIAAVHINTCPTYAQSSDSILSSLFPQLEFINKYGHNKVPQKYYPNPPLGRWVQKQRWEYKKRMDGDEEHSLNDERLKLLEDIGFVWNYYAARTSHCEDSTRNDTDVLPDLEPDEQELLDDEMFYHNAQALLAINEEIRKNRRSIIRENLRSTSASAVADNTAIRLRPCPMDGLSTDDLLNVLSYLEIHEVVTASQTCHRLDDLLSRALLRSDLLPCLDVPRWAPLFRVVDKLLENAKDCTKSLFEGCESKKYGGFQRCKECNRKIAHPPPQADGTPQTYVHVCGPLGVDCERGMDEIFTIADCVSRSGSLNSDEKTFAVDKLMCPSGIPESYERGRYFKVDATSPEFNIHGLLSEFFMRIISQGESFEMVCEETYSVLGRLQEVLLSMLIAFIVYMGPCKVGSTGMSVSGRMQIKGSGESYSNDLYIREAAFAAMEFNCLKPCRAAEGFLIAAGSFLGAVVNKRLEHHSRSTQEKTVVYFAGIRTNSLWEYYLNHSRFHYDFGRRLSPSTDEESDELSASSAEQEPTGQAPSSSDEQFRFEASDRQMAGRRCSKLEDAERRLAEAETIQQALEQQIALERQSRIEAERRLEEERRANAEQEQRRSAEQQRRSAEQQRAMANLLDCMQHLQLSFEDDS